MARPLTPLPRLLRTAPFLRSDALSFGISPERLRRTDLRSLGPSMYLSRSAEPTQRAVIYARGRRWSRGTIAGVSAAIIHDLPLPTWLSAAPAEDPTVLAFPRETPLPRSGAAAGVHTVLHSQDIALVRFAFPTSKVARVMTPERTWLSLASVVPFDYLVAIADQLLRVPRASYEGGRTRPFTTIDSLRSLLDRHPRTKGVVTARKALDLARVGADSVQETRARLAFHAAGLPEPKLNQPLNLSDSNKRRVPDFTWSEHEVIAEYDGASHRELDSFISDRDKDALVRQHGIVTVRLFSKDLPAPRRSDDARAVLARLALSRAASLVSRELENQKKGRFLS